MKRDGWRGWCKSRRKALVKLNSHEPRVSLNSIPEMEVIIITSGSGWRLRQLWLVPLWLLGVLLFSRDAPTESNDVPTIPKKPQMPTTAASNAKRLGPKQPRRRNRANCAQAAKRPNQPRSRNGFVSVWPEAASHPKRLRPKQPRRRHSPETAWSR